MPTLRDQLIVAFQVVTDDRIDGQRIGEVLELLAQFLRLAITLMVGLIGVVNVLNELADSFWDGYDATVARLRWWLFPANVVPLG